MAKRLSEKQKVEIIKFFNSGKTIDELAKIFNCTKLTISRNLKKNIDQEKYKEIVSKSKKSNKTFDDAQKKDFFEKENKSINNQNCFSENSLDKALNDISEEKSFPMNQFMEIAPLDYDIENIPQKDLSSISISEVSFPKTVYLIVNKNIELEIKYLNEYSQWEFLSKEELKRKTIEIFEDLKIAKRFCNKEQKVIKVPNTDVFRIVAPLLLSRGISRIVTSDKLISFCTLA